MTNGETIGEIERFEGMFREAGLREDFFGVGQRQISSLRAGQKLKARQVARIQEARRLRAARETFERQQRQVRIQRAETRAKQISGEIEGEFETFLKEERAEEEARGQRRLPQRVRKGSVFFRDRPREEARRRLAEEGEREVNLFLQTSDAPPEVKARIAAELRTKFQQTAARVQVTEGRKGTTAVARDPFRRDLPADFEGTPQERAVALINLQAEVGQKAAEEGLTLKQREKLLRETEQRSLSNLLTSPEVLAKLPSRNGQKFLPVGTPTAISFTKTEVKPVSGIVPLDQPIPEKKGFLGFGKQSAVDFVFVPKEGLPETFKIRTRREEDITKERRVRKEILSQRGREIVLQKQIDAIDTSTFLGKTQKFGKEFQLLSAKSLGRPASIVRASSVSVLPELPKEFTIGTVVGGTAKTLTILAKTSPIGRVSTSIVGAGLGGAFVGFETLDIERRIQARQDAGFKTREAVPLALGESVGSLAGFFAGAGFAESQIVAAPRIATISKTPSISVVRQTTAPKFGLLGETRKPPTFDREVPVIKFLEDRGVRQLAASEDAAVSNLRGFKQERFAQTFILQEAEGLRTTFVRTGDGRLIELAPSPQPSGFKVETEPFGGFGGFDVEVPKVRDIELSLPATRTSKLEIIKGAVVESKDVPFLLNVKTTATERQVQLLKNLDKSFETVSESPLALSARRAALERQAAERVRDSFSQELLAAGESPRQRKLGIEPQAEVESILIKESGKIEVKVKDLTPQIEGAILTDKPPSDVPVSQTRLVTQDVVTRAGKRTQLNIVRETAQRLLLTKKGQISIGGLEKGESELVGFGRGKTFGRRGGIAEPTREFPDIVETVRPPRGGFRGRITAPPIGGQVVGPTIEEVQAPVIGVAVAPVFRRGSIDLPQPRVDVRAEVDIKVDQDIDVVQDTKLDTPFRPRFPTVTPPPPTSSRPFDFLEPKIPKTPRPPPVPFRGFLSGGGFDFGTRGRRLKQRKDFTPTFFSSFFQVTGTPSRIGVATGLGSRPIPKKRKKSKRGRRR